MARVALPITRKKSQTLANRLQAVDNRVRIEEELHPMTLNDRRIAGPEYKLTDLVSDLRAMGVGPGDVLMVHSSMKSLGPVRGGPATVIAALQRAVGRRGTILMPAYSYCFERAYEPTEPFDRSTTPTKVGLVSETFRCSAGVVRSGHPTHSVAVWGRRAEELTADHTPAGGPMTPMVRAARAGAKVLMLGCGFRALSLLHAAEEIAEVPWLGIFNWGHRGWRPTALMNDEHGQVQRVGFRHIPGCSATFGVAQTMADENGLLRRGRVGAADVLQFDAAPVLDLVTDALRARPDLLLCAPGKCRACDDRRSVLEPSLPGAQQIAEFVADVVSRCGCRLAGTEGEDQAAERIAHRMEMIGLGNVRTLRFPIAAWKPGFSHLELGSDDTWERIDSTPVAHSPSTGGKTLEGPVVHVESLDELDKVRPRRGAIAALWDGYGASRHEFRRLMSAGFKALLLVDRRFGHGDVVAEGVPARWLPDFKTPAVSMPHAQAVRLFARDPVACRVKVDSRVVAGESTVVSGEIAGRGPGVILLCGHHDTTGNSAAPDDNLSGVAVVLRVAAVLIERGLRPRHTIRFCSFGAEEQLSEGARWYALESGEAEAVRFVINSDSVGARCGTTGVYVTGGDPLVEWLRAQSRRTPLQFKLSQEVCPFSDQFPFNCLGVPSLWFYRKTIVAGRHFHHTFRDTLSEISFDRLAQLADFQAALVETLADAAKLPFPGVLSGKMREAVAEAKQNWLD
jgi:aminoglycoside 3-N-acetyltransferase